MQRDFTYVDDIIEGIVKVIDNPVKEDKNWSGSSHIPSTYKTPYKIYNIGNNSPVKLMNFIKMLERFLGIEAIKDFQPIQAGDVFETFADVSSLIEDFDYKPDTPIEKGIQEFVIWYRNFKS